MLNISSAIFKIEDETGVMGRKLIEYWENRKDVQVSVESRKDDKSDYDYNNVDESTGKDIGGNAGAFYENSMTIHIGN